jgi:spore maturation protein CgeB
MRIALISEQQSHNLPSNSYYNIVGSINSTNGHYCELYDNYHLIHPDSFDIILCLDYFHKEEMDEKFGDKLALLWVDLGAYIHEIKDKIEKYKHIVWGEPTQYKIYHKNVLVVPDTPQDLSIFKPRDLQKEYDVLFNGSLYHERNLILDKFSNIVKLGARKLLVEDYATNFNKAKICLSVSKDIYGYTIPTGRPWEIAASKAFLMSSHVDIISKYFDLNYEFVELSEENIKYYLKEDNHREDIANNIYRKYLRYYSPQIHWNRVVDFLC